MAERGRGWPGWMKSRASRSWRQARPTSSTTAEDRRSSALQLRCHCLLIRVRVHSAQGTPRLPLRPAHLGRSPPIRPPLSRGTPAPAFLWRPPA